MKSIRIVFGIALFSLITGCQSGEATSQYQLPSGWKAFKIILGRDAIAIPVKMDDGTKCIIVSGNGGEVAISCDWSAQ